MKSLAATADLNKEIAMKIYHVVSVYKDALVDGTNNSDQHKFAVCESDEQKFDSMGSPKLTASMARCHTDIVLQCIRASSPCASPP